MQLIICHTRVDKYFFLEYMSTLIGATLHGKALLLSVSTSRHSDEAWSYRELDDSFLGLP